jgi:undecaprenyl-diphosphatase
LRKPWPFLFLGVCAAIGVGWLLGGIVEEGAFSWVDRPVLHFLVSIRSPFLTDLMRYLTFFGSTPIVIATLLAAVVVARRKTLGFRWPAFLALTLLGSSALDNLIKFLVNRPRPTFHPLAHAFGSSFPSGHSTAAAGLFFSLAYLATRHRARGPSLLIWCGAGIAALVVGTSRVYLGVHWPTDVLGGLALGGFWVAVSATVSSELTTNAVPDQTRPPV